MIEFNRFYSRSEFTAWREHFEEAIARRANPARHGDLKQWLNTIDKLPDIEPSVIKLDSDTLTFGLLSDIPKDTQVKLTNTLKELSPWRKGPFQVFDTFIDTEWRSDWKWQRLRPHISSLKNRKVLDVGCGTGYHCWRFLGDGAKYVLGIDPSMRFLVQYLAIQHFAKDERFDFLPIGIEDMPNNLSVFDTVFSMGVLYHRREPIKHLLELKNLMTEGGELVLETLIVDDAEDGVLQPKGRYAQMRNVWNIMTVEKIEILLGEAGFYNIRCVNQNTTSVKEQRSTDWMQYHSLEQFLDANDLSKTIEAYPAPKRGIFIAEKK